MMQENIYPFLVWFIPPTSADEAARRVSEHGAGSLLTAPMTKMIRCRFLNYDQFKRALVDCKFTVQDKFEMGRRSAFKTIKATLENVSTKTVWHLMGTQYPDYFEIQNVELVTAPQESPEDVETFKSCLYGEESQE